MNCCNNNNNDGVFFIFCQLFSGKEVTERLTKIKEILSDTNNDWEKRVEAVRIVLRD